MAARNRTTLNLDMELVAEARRVLDTSQVTETIHRALEEVINQDKRRRLLRLGTGDLTPDRLEEMRSNRYAGDSPLES